MKRYAESTSVSVEKSKAEIEGLLARYGATAFASGWEPGRAMIQFEAQGRRIRFVLPLPHQDHKRFTMARIGRSKHLTARSLEAAHKAWEQACRQSWRALALVVKAKLEAVAAGITTFEDEFLSHVVMPDGRTVGEHVRPKIALAYDGGHMPPMLPDYSEAAP